MNSQPPSVDEDLLGRYLTGSKFYDVLGDVDGTYLFAWGSSGSPQGQTTGVDASMARARIEDKIQRGYVLVKGSPRFTAAGKAQRQAQCLEQEFPQRHDELSKPRF